MRGQLTLRKTEKKSKFQSGSIAYTMPKRPQQKYTMMDKNQRDISKQIQFIPFASVRNLISVFMKPYPQGKNQISQILASQYDESDHLRMLDQHMTERIRKAYHRKLKLEMIQKCMIKSKAYQKQVQDINGRDRGDPLRELQQKLADIQKKHRNIQQQWLQQKQQKRILQKQMQQQKRYRGDSVSSKSNASEIQRQKHRKQKDEKNNLRYNKNQQIIDLFKQYSPEFQRKNVNYLDKSHIYNEIKQFSTQFQKVIPIVWRKEAIVERQQASKSKNIVDYISLNILQQKTTLLKLIRQSVSELQFFRQHVKNADHIQNQNIADQFDSDQKQLERLSSQLDLNERQVKDTVYHSLRWCENIGQCITDGTIGRRMESNEDQYEKFVKKYTDIKQVINCQKRVKQFNKIILEEQKYLSHHLEINCGLIVHYKSSEDFRQFHDSLKKRTYIKQMFERQIQPIQEAIRYINQKHNEMYQDACDGRFSRSEVNQELAKFKKFYEQGDQEMKMLAEQNNRGSQNRHNHYEQDQHNSKQYYVHLIQSLKRLVALCKR